MAATPVEFDCIAGLTLTLELRARGNDDTPAAASAAATERTNDKGNYVATVTDLAAGVYKARIRDASDNTLARGVLFHANGTDVETVGSFDAAKQLLQADVYIDTSTTPWQVVHIEKGSGTLATGTRLLAQDLLDEAGGGVTAITTFIGQKVAP